MKMLLICGVLLMFTGSAVGLITVDDQCRSDQSCVFYGAVGRPLYLQLPDEEELKLFRIKRKYFSDRILQFKDQKMIENPSDPRWQFNTENKTMIITRAEKKDSAGYRLETFNSAGTNTGIYYLHLIIEGLITVDDQCRSDQSCVFYGALGRPLYLQLPEEEELKLYMLKINYYSDRILHFKNQQIIGKPSDPRWQFNTENKTLIITRAEKKDSAKNRLHTYNSTGTNTGSYYFQLIIEAGVSSVKMTDSCFTRLKRRVHCLSDGDDIEFSWTLNGIPQNQNLTDGNRILLLDRSFTGNVSCYVNNHVSNGSATIKIGHCPAVNIVDDLCMYQSCEYYGALGRPMYLQLPDDEELYLQKLSSTYQVLRFKDPIIQQHPLYPRWQFFPENRTLIITRAEKIDIGPYQLLAIYSGWRRHRHNFDLNLEAVVSSVEVMDSCSFSMKRRVNCSSDGDQIQFSWTLSGTTFGSRLTDGNQTLLLDKDYTGNVTCYVENYVSSGNRTIELQQCPDIIVFVLVWVLEIIVLLVLLGGFHIYGRILRKRSIKRNSRSAESKSFEFPAD